MAGHRRTKDVWAARERENSCAVIEDGDSIAGGQLSGARQRGNAKTTLIPDDASDEARVTRIGVRNRQLVAQSVANNRLVKYRSTQSVPGTIDW